MFGRCFFLLKTPNKREISVAIVFASGFKGSSSNRRNVGAVENVLSR